MTTTAMTTTQKVKALIQGDAFKEQLGAMGRSLLTPEAFTRITLTAINKTPKLAECSQSSLFGALLDCYSLGIEPDGRRAHLIPYGKTCQLIIDYKGLIELAKRSGEVKDWNAVAVYEGEAFDYHVDEHGEHLLHKPDPFSRGDDRKVLGYYSMAVLKDGTTSVEFMSLAEIMAIKKRSKASGNGPWKTDEGEMSKKTVIRRHSKRLTLSPEFRNALDVDDDKPRDITDQVDAPDPWEKVEVEEPKDEGVVEAEVVEPEVGDANEEGLEELPLT